MKIALPVYSDIVRIRDEVLGPEGLVDHIDLAHISEVEKKKRQKLGERVPVAQAVRDPAAFFRMTYPTEDVQRTLYALRDRLEDPRRVAGTIVLTGRYGLGKSHILLAAHHALCAPDVARGWAAEWRLPELVLPGDARVVTRSFIKRTAENLWGVLFEALGCPERVAKVTTFPDAEMIEGALDNRHTILILDELERWFGALPDKTARGRNLAFIQALSEVADRDSRITVVTSVLGVDQEPAETLRRTRPLELAFRSDLDRQRVLLFRIFANHGEHDTARVAEVVDAYIDAWHKAGITGLDEVRTRLAATYPFSPELLDILTKKVPNLSGFQNTRGSLRFLSSIVRHTRDTRPLISSQDVPFKDAEVHNTLRNLDDSGGEVVRRALGDNYEAVPSTLPHRDELFSTILFYSITDPSLPGATEEQVLLATLDPGENPHKIRDGLAQLKQLAFNLHQQEQRFLFRTQENPHARINAMAGSPAVKRDAWQAIIADAVSERWGARDRTAVLTGKPEEMRTAVNQLANRGLCYLLSIRALTPTERLQLQNLADRRNMVLLLEPMTGTDLGRNEGRYDLRNDERLVSRARRIEACNLLLEGQPGPESEKVYRKVRDDEKKALVAEASKQYGFYVSWNRAGASDAPVDDSWYELGRFDELKSPEFQARFQQEHSGFPAVKDRTRKLWPEFERAQAGKLIDHFAKTPGEPVPYEPNMVARALRELAREGLLALEDMSGRTYGVTTVGQLAEKDLPSCTLIKPPAVPPPPPPDELPVHVRVVASYDAERQAVALSWVYPEIPGDDVTWKTVVQRYLNVRGWKTGETYPVELDQTHETNRYIGTDEQFVDDQKLSPGACYYYYVFLIESVAGAEPRAILSQRCDVLIPAETEPERPDEIKVPAQPQHHKLLIEVEKRVMSSKVMSAESRVRKVVVRLTGLRNHEAVSALGDRLAPRDGTLESVTDVTFTVRGELDRQQVLDLMRRLPREDAHYEAVLYLRQDTKTGGEKG
jgi:DNA replication protein DnaC